MIRINIGCGMTPTEGWVNYDNSPSLVLSRLPAAATRAMQRIGLISERSMRYVDFCRNNKILKADATKKVPHAPGSVDVLYASHMIEHLDRREASLFLQEALRVLKPAGVLRLAVPNLRYHLEAYIADKDADKFVSGLGVCRPKPDAVISRIKDAVLGARHHHWMYDDGSLPKLLTNCGFVEPAVLEPGKTTIKDPGTLNLFERSPESLFVEARKPVRVT